MSDSAKEVILIKGRFLENVVKGSKHMLYHLVTLGLSAALVLSLPRVIRFAAEKFPVYWSRIGNDKTFLISVEMILGVVLIFLFNAIRKSWRDRKLSNMARAAGMVLVTPARGFFVRRKIRKLKEKQGIARDVMVISSTGFRTFVDPEGELHQVIQNCRKAKIMLLNPNSEGAMVRAKGIPHPDVTPESLREQIQMSIDFLKALKAAQKNVRLKLYPDPPFLKMTILGDYIWLQHYQPGLDIQGTPKYVFKHDPNLGSLYFPFYQYFLGKWDNPGIPEYDLGTDELIYRDGSGNEVRREKLVHAEGIKNEVLMNGNPREGDHQREAFSALRPHQNATCFGNFHASGWRHLHSGLHPGGKQFFLLRSKNPICETAAWINIL